MLKFFSGQNTCCQLSKFHLCVALSSHDKVLSSHCAEGKFLKHVFSLSLNSHLV